MRFLPIAVVGLAVAGVLASGASFGLSADGHARTVSGHRGVNRLVVGAKGMRPGRHRLAVELRGGRARSISFSVVG